MRSGNVTNAGGTDGGYAPQPSESIPHDGRYTPQSPKSPAKDAGYVPQSPTSPPPDIDSDTDDVYDDALVAARRAVPADVWEAFSPDEKKACVEKEMEALICSAERHRVDEG